MREGEPVSQDMLPDALRRAMLLYWAQRLLKNVRSLEELLGVQTREKGIMSDWRSLAENFPPFTENIVRLGKLLDVAEATADSTDPTKVGALEEALMDVYFPEIRDEDPNAKDAKFLLTQLLLGRISEIAAGMKEAFGIENGEPKYITLEDVMGGVLTGKLNLGGSVKKLTRQLN